MQNVALVANAVLVCIDVASSLSALSGAFWSGQFLVDARAAGETMTAIALQTLSTSAPHEAEKRTCKDSQGDKAWQIPRAFPSTHRSGSIQYGSGDTRSQTWECRITADTGCPMHGAFVVLYTITTVLPCGKIYSVSRRFSRFCEFLAKVQDFYKVNHRQFVKNIPRAPPRHWMWADHSDSAFILKRKCALELVLRRLMGIPHITECPAVRNFLLDY